MAARADIEVFAPSAKALAAAGASAALSDVTSTSAPYTAQTAPTAFDDNVASAYASLSQGILRGYASSGSTVPLDSLAIAQSSFHDTVHFNNTSGAIAALSLTYAVDGGLSRNPNIFAPAANDSASLFLSGCGGCYNNLGQRIQIGTSGLEPGDAARMSFGLNGVTGFDDFQSTIDPARFLTGSTFAGGHMTGFISTTLFIPTGMTTLGVGADLRLDCRSGAVCDFGHTAQFSFGALANGLSFTSESGTFLSDAPVSGGVPEPASWTLMIAGFGLAGAMLRRRRAPAAA